MVLKKHHLILTIVVLVLSAGALFIFTRSPEELIPGRLVESPPVKNVAPVIVTPQAAPPVIEHAAVAPKAVVAPAPATASLSPERLEEIKAANAEIGEMNRKHRTERRDLKERQRDLRRQMRNASPEERKAQKQRDHAEMKALTERQKEETKQVRGDRGLSGDEMKVYLEQKRAEREQNIQSARNARLNPAADSGDADADTDDAQ